jgi:Flp pilus assembly protein TadG
MAIEELIALGIAMEKSHAVEVMQNLAKAANDAATATQRLDKALRIAIPDTVPNGKQEQEQ